MTGDHLKRTVGEKLFAWYPQTRHRCATSYNLHFGTLDANESLCIPSYQKDISYRPLSNITKPSSSHNVSQRFKPITGTPGKISAEYGQPIGDINQLMTGALPRPIIKKIIPEKNSADVSSRGTASTNGRQNSSGRIRSKNEERSKKGQEQYKTVSRIAQSSQKGYYSAIPVLQSDSFICKTNQPPKVVNVSRPTTTPLVYDRYRKVSLGRSSSNHNKILRRNTSPDVTKSVLLKRPKTSYFQSYLTEKAIELNAKRCASAPAGKLRTSDISTSAIRPIESVHVSKEYVKEEIKSTSVAKEQDVSETDDTRKVECNTDQCEETVHMEQLFYEKAVKRYGWRAQIPGDPHGVVSLEERPMISAKCPEPDIAPDIPTIHINVADTFFSKTIPSRPKTFVIHSEWLSELLAKRILLQPRDTKFNTRKFAFAY